MEIEPKTEITIEYPEFSYDNLNAKLNASSTVKQLKSHDNLYIAISGSSDNTQAALVPKEFIRFERRSIPQANNNNQQNTKPTSSKLINDDDHSVGFESEEDSVEKLPSKPKLIDPKTPRRKQYIKAIRDNMKNPLTQGEIKFHISLPEKHPEELKKGWDVVKEILIAHSITSFKVIRPGCKTTKKPAQRGKVITVYGKLEINMTAQDWLLLLQEITLKLKNQGIRPGYRPPLSGNMLENGAKAEKAIKGSNYITYRYDSRWPSIDPFQASDMVVNVPDQLDVEPWEESTKIEDSSVESDIREDIINQNDSNTSCCSCSII